jgi:pilus assembly protein TadC
MPRLSILRAPGAGAPRNILHPQTAKRRAGDRRPEGWNDVKSAVSLNPRARRKVKRTRLLGIRVDERYAETVRVECHLREMTLKQLVIAAIEDYLDKTDAEAGAKFIEKYGKPIKKRNCEAPVLQEGARQ